MVKYRMYSFIHLSDFLSMYYVLGIGQKNYFEQKKQFVYSLGPYILVEDWQHQWTNNNFTQL